MNRLTIYRQKSRYGPMMTTSQLDEKLKNLTLKMKLTIYFIASDKCTKF